MGSFPETYNDRNRKDETNANKYYICMRSDVFEKSTKFYTFSLVNVRRFSRPSRSIHLGDVSEANGRETPHFFSRTT